VSDVGDYTRAQFDALPSRGWDEDVGEFNSLVILPTRHKHDSGYRCMDFAACRRNDGGEIEPFCRLSGYSDVLHLGGIGGYGDDWLERYGHVPRLTPPVAWSMDCLPKSGLLRLFVPQHNLRADVAVSSFEVYAVPRKAGRP